MTDVGLASRARRARSGGWRVSHASVVGLSHARSGAVCQDAVGVRLLGNSTLVAAVADGAGSARHADVGAQLAVRHAIARFSEAGALPPWNAARARWEEFFRSIVRGIREELDAESASRGVPSRELATTLLLVVARPSGLAAAQIGDGAVVVMGEEGRLELLTRPTNGEFANVTVFVTSPDAFEQLQVQTIRPGARRLALLTDGLERVALDLRELRPHARFFEPLFGVTERHPSARASAALEKFLMSDRVRAVCDDDLTLVLVVPPAAVENAPEAPVTGDA